MDAPPGTPHGRPSRSKRGAAGGRSPGPTCPRGDPTVGGPLRTAGSECELGAPRGLHWPHPDVMGPEVPRLPTRCLPCRDLGLLCRWLPCFQGLSRKDAEQTPPYALCHAPTQSLTDSSWPGSRVPSACVSPAMKTTPGAHPSWPSLALRLTPPHGHLTRWQGGTWRRDQSWSRHELCALQPPGW